MTTTIALADAQPGDVGFTHSKGVIGAGIRWDQRLRGDVDWDVNHMFILDRPTGDGDWFVIQAEAHGVTGHRNDGTAYLPRRLSEVAPGGWYEIRPAPLGVDRVKELEFARGEVGVHYGFLTIASAVTTQLTPQVIRIDFRRDSTWICSALGAEALRAGGWIRRWPDLYQARPAQVRAALP